jgi:hypothetical protein
MPKAWPTPWTTLTHEADERKDPSWPTNYPPSSSKTCP